jgi:hypothetical protein
MCWLFFGMLALGGLAKAVGLDFPNQVGLIQPHVSQALPGPNKQQLQRVFEKTASTLKPRASS